MVEVIKNGVWSRGQECPIGMTLKLPAAEEKRLIAGGWCKQVKKTSDKPKDDEQAEKPEQPEDAPDTSAPDGDG